MSETSINKYIEKEINIPIFFSECSIDITDTKDYFISPDKCTECKGFHEEPQCAAVCPVDCCVPDDQNVETEQELLSKQKFMHPDN